MSGRYQEAITIVHNDDGDLYSVQVVWLMRSWMLSVPHCLIHSIFALRILPLSSHFRVTVGECLSGPHSSSLLLFQVLFSFLFYFFIFCFLTIFSHPPPHPIPSDFSHFSLFITSALYLLSSFHIFNQCLGPRWTSVLGSLPCSWDKMSIFQGQHIPYWDSNYLYACIYCYISNSRPILSFLSLIFRGSNAGACQISH